MVLLILKLEINTMTQNDKIISFLVNGKNRKLTVEQAQQKWGVQNLRARICELRDRGHEIETTTTKRSGRVVTAYTMNS